LTAQQKIEWNEGALASRSSKMLAGFALIILSGVFVASVIFNPDGYFSMKPYFTICGFKNFTGLPCPGCGLTHSFCAIGKGNFISAFGFNLLGPPLFLTFAMLWMRSAGVLLKKYKPVIVFDRMAERFHLVKSFLFAFAVFGLLRIIYLLIFYPQLMHDSPMFKLAARLFQ
jgi:hypothetical protein